MTSRQIRAAMKRKGVDFSSVQWEWTPTPGETVPCYVVHLTAEAADHFGEMEFNQFDDTQQALDWIDDLAPFEALAHCRLCGCTDMQACPGGCYWIEPDLCSACADAELPF